MGHLLVLMMDGPCLLLDFNKSTLLRSSKGLTFVHLSLDPTTVDPWHSDPTDQICTSPLLFLWSLDADLTITVVLPPELLISLT
jgi:hypothetical protein